MEKDTISKLIIETIKKEEPDTLSELLVSLKRETSLENKYLMEIIREMEGNETIHLTNQSQQKPINLERYIFSKESYWLWSIIIIETATINAELLIGADSILLPIKYILSIVFLLFLPGYSLMRALFPGRRIDSEIIILSLGISLSLLPLISFLLNYTPWGIRLLPVTLSLILVTTSFVLISLVRDVNQRR